MPCVSRGKADETAQGAAAISDLNELAVCGCKKTPTPKQNLEAKVEALINGGSGAQFHLKVTSVYKSNLEALLNSYGFGKIFEEKANPKNKSPNVTYNWIVKDFEEYKKVYNYLKICPLKSVKRHRMRLTLFYFKYKKLKYHLAPAGSPKAKLWAKFCKSWYKYMSV